MMQNQMKKDKSVSEMPNDFEDQLESGKLRSKP